MTTEDPRARVHRAELALKLLFPDRLRDLYEAGDGRLDSDGAWAVWPLERVVDDNLRVWREGLLPRSLLAFGDDGTGNPFCVPFDGTDEVVRWNWIDDAVEYREGTLAQFLAEWVPEESGPHPRG